jgi:predicted metalloprotease with PDZ domain
VWATRLAGQKGESLVHTVRLWASIALCLAAGHASAEAPAAAPPNAKSITDLIKQLDADEFPLREEASRQLTELGAPAVPELVKAAQQPNAEVSTRAFAILEAFLDSRDQALPVQARQALKQIASQREAAQKNQDDSLAARAATAAAILGRPFLGVFGGGADEGAMVVDVVEGSPAEKTGIQPGDIILSFAGVPTPTFPALVAAVGKKEPGDRAKVEIEREGEKKALEVTVGRLKE